MPFFILSALVIGAAGFAAGFFGPMILEPGSNQGPLLGILITGPLGLVVGAILGVGLPRVLAERLRWRVLAALAILTLVGIPVGLVCLRSPEFVGRLYFAEVANPRPAPELIPAAVQSWENQAKQYPHSPQTGWQEDRRTMVTTAGGQIVTLTNATVWYVHRQRKLWHRGRHTYTPQPSEAQREAYVAPAGLLASPGWYLATNSGVPAAWPPRNVGDFLGVVEITAAPPGIRPPEN